MITRQDLIDMGYEDGPTMTEALDTVNEQPARFKQNKEQVAALVAFVFDYARMEHKILYEFESDFIDPDLEDVMLMNDDGA
jgi:hypothetical protein